MPSSDAPCAPPPGLEGSLFYAQTLWRRRDFDGCVGACGARAAEAAGKLAARMWSLRRMSLAIAITLDPGPDGEKGTPKATVDLATEAALVKDMGTFYEREIIDAARLLATTEPTPDADDTFERHLAETIVCAPVATIRGGTTQVLRNLIARKLLGPLK